MSSYDTTSLTELEAELDNAIGAVWLAYIGGAIAMKDADRLHQALERAARRHTPLPAWAHVTGDTRH